MGRQVIFSDTRDPRFITVRRGGTLQDSDHHLLAVWAADCAQHVLHFFEQAQPGDDRPRRAIKQARAWVRSEITMMQARTAAFAANTATREVSVAAKEAAHAAGQAVAPEDEREEAGRLECQWQRAQLPGKIRELVLDDQRLHNEKCWFLFDC